MPTFDLTFTGDTPAAVAVATLLRSDTGMPPSGVSLPLSLALSGGAWTGTFTDASPPAYYTYTLAITWIDGSTETAGPASLTGSSPTGVYSDLTAWDDFAGGMNVQIYSDKDDAGAINFRAVQRAMDYADDQINLKFTGHYAVPLVFNAGTVSETVRTWATVIGLGKWLYFGRGLYDAKGNDPIGNRFAGIVKDVYAEMDEYCGAWRRLPCQPAIGVGAGTAPVAVPQTVLADGSPYQTTPPYPVMRWTGYLWVW